MHAKPNALTLFFTLALSVILACHQVDSLPLSLFHYYVELLSMHLPPTVTVSSPAPLPWHQAGPGQWQFTSYRVRVCHFEQCYAHTEQLAVHLTAMHMLSFDCH